MRITDLLDKRSISLDAVCASKSDALDQAVALMVKSGKINDEEAYRKQVYLREEEVPQVSEKEVQSHMANVMQSANRDWQLWSSKMA